MNPKENIPNPAESLEEIEVVEATGTVDDFIKELEAKEKDLHITSEVTIEIDESDFDPEILPDFVIEDLSATAKNSGTFAGHTGGLKTRVFELQNEIDALQARIRELRADRDEIQEKSDRRLKDFENFKYRMDRERRGSFIEQICTLASQMLPVLDNLERALQSVENDQFPKGPEFQQFYDGIVLVSQQVNEIFAGMGVQPIESIGDIFDPNLHEAVAAETRDDLPANTISAEMLRGYRIGNRVIRHSMVKVTTCPSKAPPASKSHPDPSTLPDLDPPDPEESETQTE